MYEIQCQKVKKIDAKGTDLDLVASRGAVAPGAVLRRLLRNPTNTAPLQGRGQASRHTH